MKNPLFYAKILLFGEYGIIEDSHGLTLPFNFYKGSLKFDDSEDKNFQEKSNESLFLFAKHLEKLSLPKAYTLDSKALLKDVSEGMYFDSNIPQGYGVGSSGALVAAIFDKYVIDKKSANHISKEQLVQMKEVFGEMESFFHGKSSGIDPLICFMNIPLFIKSKDSINTLGIEEDQKGKGAIFLLNSGKPGETEPMVQIFFDKLKNEGFRSTLKNEFIKYNDACIKSFIDRDFNPFFQNLKELSRWAYINFKPMIPNRFLRIWEEGIRTNKFYLKLCGSGGGGYILGFAPDYELAEELLQDYETEVVYRF